MATSTQLKAVIIMLCLFFGNTYSPYGKWVLTSKNLKDGKIKDLSSYNNNPIQQLENGQGTAITTGILNCNSFYADGTGQYFGSLTSTSSSLTEVGISVWMNIPDGDSLIPFTAGSSPTSTLYKIQVERGGYFHFSPGDITLSGPITPGTWMLVSFSFYKIDAIWGFSVQIPGFNLIKYSDAQNAYPGNYFTLGFNFAKAYYYEVQYFKTPSLSTSNIITFYDDSMETYVATTFTCPNSCSTYCHSEKGCLKTTCICPTYCTCSADNDVCISCNDLNADITNSCQCKAGYHLQENSCVFSNFYTVHPANCAAWISSVCYLCYPGYFIYENDVSTTCLGNFYLACANSCSSCSATPNCFTCADLIIQDGDSCKVDSIGYRFSFSYPNIIVIVFSYELSETLTIGNLKATTMTNQDISTANWKISNLSTLRKYQIITDLSVSQLPINLDFSFNRDS